MSDWIDNTPPRNQIPNSNDWVNLSIQEKSNMIVIVVFFVIAFLTRNTKYFGWMWKCTMMILLSLFIAGAVNVAKDKIKDWWND
jgi:hypothetical protein